MQTPTFGKYEMWRIVLPGFYFALLFFFFYWSFLILFLPLSLPFIAELLIFAGIVLLSGLTMYAKESPKRRKAFLENQPSQYLGAKARAMKGTALLQEAEARTLYFYILNNHIPPIFHEKIFFFGAVYFVVVQVRRTSFWYGCLGLAALLMQLSMGLSLPEQQPLMLFTVLVWFIYLLNIRYNKADRKMQENYRDQIFWMHMNNDLIESILRKRESVPPVQ